MIENAVLLMRDNYDAVGFLPRSALERAEHENRIYYQIDDGCWVGYLLVGPIYPQKPVYIWQECIDKGARRYGSGKRCFEKLLFDAKVLGAYSIRLRCAEGLESNLFWQSMGFKVIEVDTTPNKRKRAVFRYELVVTPSLFELYASSPSIRIFG